MLAFGLSWNYFHHRAYRYAAVWADAIGFSFPPKDIVFLASVILALVVVAAIFMRREREK